MTIYRGRCRDCGDEWEERDPIAICPECHSLDVEETSGFGEADLARVTEAGRRNLADHP